MGQEIKVKRKRALANPVALFGIGLVVGLGLGFSTGAASGGEFIPALAWNLISFGLGGVAVLLFQWATGRDAKRKQIAADHH